MKKIKYLLCLILLASCTSLNLLEISNSSIINNKKTSIENTNNESILSDENLSKEVFNKKKRNINKNIRGVWVSTVLNLDFPSKKGLDEKTLKKEIDNIVNNVKEMGLNAIFFQVKPNNDAFYHSKNLPWSRYLTGKEGVIASFDVLDYFIKKAHENNIELHAWINPYRVSMNTNYDELSSKNIAKIHPEWVFEYAGKLYLNPAKKEVVKYLYENIEEIVKNYDIDGIHLDDYFYPYPVNNKPLPNFDKEEYIMYAKENQSLGEFRRENVNELIKNLSVSIHKIKPNISFGVSPFGIWRNYKTDIRGSKTDGLASYDTLYADVITWMENSWIDYVAPQIYWHIGHDKADYETLVEWWNKEAKRTDTVLYIGEGIYKFNTWEKDEIKKHRLIRQKNSNVNGYIIFRYQTINENRWIADEI